MVDPREASAKGGPVFDTETIKRHRSNNEDGIQIVCACVCMVSTNFVPFASFGHYVSDRPPHLIYMPQVVRGRLERDTCLASKVHFLYQQTSFHISNTALWADGLH